MKHLSRILLFVFLMISVPFAGSALTLKLGSLAPAGSPWDKALKQVAARWKQISGGQVILRIYPGGIAGDELEMIRKMRLGSLHLAAVSAVGLNSIYQGILSLSVPMTIRDNRELDYVIEKMRPFLEAKLLEKRYKPLAWIFAGWTHWYGKRSFSNPEGLKKQKIWVSKGSADETVMWKNGGFHPVPLDATDLVVSLQSGMVEAICATNLTAANFQWFGIANHLADFNWAPMIAGVIISERAWNRIPKKFHKPFLEAIAAEEATMTDETIKADAEALRVMKENGLVVVPVSESDKKLWEDLIKDNFDEIIDKNFSREAYSLVEGYIEEFRKQNE